MTVFPQIAVRDDVLIAPGLAALVTARGYSRVGLADSPDVRVVNQLARLSQSQLQAVRGGGGLVVLIEGTPTSSPEPPVGSSSIDRFSTAVIHLLAEAGITLQPDPPGSTATVADLDATAEFCGLDLLARVDPSALTANALLRVAQPAGALLRSATGSRAADLTDGATQAVAALTHLGKGRVVVLGIAVDGQPASNELLFNALTYAAGHLRHRRTSIRSSVTVDPAWLRLKQAVSELQPLQAQDGSVPEPASRRLATELLATISGAVVELAPRFGHDSDYLSAVVKDLTRWSEGGFGVPDFLDSLTAFHPETGRVDGREHLVLFPMYTQNGSTDRHLEAVLVQVIWPDFVAELEAGAYSNKLFVPIRFLDFTAGYDSNSAVLFPETIAMREVPKFTWGAIFADREAARFRKVVSAAAEITKLAMPPDAARLLEDQQLTEETFVMWDLIHDRTHMHGDLPFDPFMIKQRMPYFLYSLEELRCDLTAFRESVALEQLGVPHARLVQYAVLFDRIFRFAITGSRVRNYDGLGGQLLFAWLHQRHVLHWTDNRLSIDWDKVTDAVLELGEQIESLYWRSIDRPKINHWLAAYQLVAGTVEPHPASTWAKGAAELPVSGPPKFMTDAVLPDEFPLSMFYEALSRKLGPVVASTAGITG
jgi:hypothetical protein